MRKLGCFLIVGMLVLLVSCNGNMVNSEIESEISTVTETVTSVTETITEIITETLTATETETSAPVSESVPLTRLQPNDEIRQLKTGLYYTEYNGNDYLDEFLAQGGAKNDKELFNYLVKCIFSGKAGFSFDFGLAGCSTISVKGSDGGQYFGRNFDWKTCKALILKTNPSKGYSSVTTVNMDFVTSTVSYELSDNIIKFCAMYTPLDGMNEKGLCVSVNMVTDSASINQNTGKTDITTSTAIRLILDKASTVSEAVNLLKSYDMHASFGYMVHFAIADASGKSVAVEYINNKMVVTETPVLTNFYVAPSKFGIGSKKSVHRYDVLMGKLEEKQTMNEWEVRDALSSVSKKHYDENEYPSTEWSIIFDQKKRTATYFHRENYSKGYQLSV